MENNNPSQLLDFCIDIAKKAGKLQMNYFGNISSLKKKTTNIDLLTNADIESENLIVNLIRKEYPKHSILTEENLTKERDSEYRWIIDPLDGTTNFVHNIPIFSISIGLQYKNTIICGVVYNPAAEKCFQGNTKTRTPHVAKPTAMKLHLVAALCKSIRSARSCNQNAKPTTPIPPTKCNARSGQ